MGPRATGAGTGQATVVATHGAKYILAQMLFIDLEAEQDIDPYLIEILGTRKEKLAFEASNNA